MLAAPIALAGWGGIWVVPGFGLDPSWVTALALAAEGGLNYGSDIVYTYGPLGFLTQPNVIDGDTAVLGVLYLVLLHYALALTLLWAARRSFALPVALVLAFVGTLLTGDAVDTLALVWCVVALSREPPRFALPLLVYGGGFVAALELLVKVNNGVLVTALCAIAVLAHPLRREAAPRFAAVLAGTFALLWGVTGQSFADLLDYARGSYEISAGYSAGMVIDAGAVGWDEPAAVLAIIAALGAAYMGTRGLERWRRAGVFVVVAVFLFLEFKHGFIRHHPAFVVGFFGAMLAPWLAFRWSGRARLAPLVAVAAISSVYFAATQGPVFPTLDPYERIDGGITQIRGLISPGRRAELRDRARAQLTELYDVDPRTESLLRGHGVHAEPWEVALIWALDLDWDPVPVFQPVSAYTPYLDRRNAEAFSSDGSPERVLRHRASVYVNIPIFPLLHSRLSLDNRFAPYDAPAATLAMLCNYRPLRTTGRYQVLAHTTERCGEARSLGSVEAGYRERVPVPEPGPGEVVFARVAGLAPSGIEAVRTTLYRAPRRHVDFGPGPDLAMIAENAEDGLILRAAPGVDFPRPFQLAPGAEVVGFHRDEAFASPDRTLEIEFFAMPVKRVPPGELAPRLGRAG